MFFLVVPSVLLILAPFGFLFVDSWFDESGQFVTSQLLELLLSSRQIGLLKNSFFLAFGTAICSAVVGVPLAFIIHRTDMAFRKFFLFASLVPLIIPPYLQAIVWTKYFPVGPLSTLLPDIYSIPGGVFIFTLSYFPFITLLVSAGLTSCDTSLEEASLLNNSPFDTIRKVTLPLVAPHLSTGMILVFIFTVVNFEAADILRLKVYPIEIFINFSAFYNEKAATILSLPLVCVTLILIWGQLVCMRGKSYVNLSTPSSVSTFHLGSYNSIAMVFSCLVFLFSVMLPLMFLLDGAGGVMNYWTVFKSSHSQLFYSFWIAIVASFFMVTLSFPISYYLVRGKWKAGTMMLDYISQMPLGLPSIVLGIGMIKVWNHQRTSFFYDSSALLIIALVCAYCPFVIKIISNRIKQINVSFEEAGLLSNNSKKVIFFKILLPMTSPGIFAGFVCGFILSLSNLGTALLVIEPGKATLPIRIYNFMHYGADEMVFALSLMIIALTMVTLLISGALYKYTSRVRLV